MRESIPVEEIKKALIKEHERCEEKMEKAASHGGYIYAQEYRDRAFQTYLIGSLLGIDIWKEDEKKLDNAPEKK